MEEDELEFETIFGPHCPPELEKRIKEASNPLDLFITEETLAQSITTTVFRASLDYDSFADVTVKLIHTDELEAHDWGHVMREVNIHSRLSHEHIVQFYCAFMAADGCIYIILEYCGRGDLFSLIRDAGGLSEPDAVTNVIKPLLSALDYLHGLEVVHRDIKPENLLVGDAGTVKLADFGLAVDLSVERASSFAGTKPFIAPEILLEPEQRDQLDTGLQPESASLNLLRNRLSAASGGDMAEMEQAQSRAASNATASAIAASQPSTSGGRHAVTLRADIWSLGVLAYEVRTFTVPFQDLYGEDKYFPENVTAEEIAKEVGKLDRSRLTIDYWDFVQLCLKVNPRSRPSAFELLSHCLLRRVTLQERMSVQEGRSHPVDQPSARQRGRKIIGDGTEPAPEAEPAPLLSGLAPRVSVGTVPAPAPQVQVGQLPIRTPQLGLGRGPQTAVASAKDAKEAEALAQREAQKRKAAPFGSCPDPSAGPTASKRTSPPSQGMAALTLTLDGAPATAPSDSAPQSQPQRPAAQKQSNFQAFKQRIVNSVAGKKRG